MNDNGMTRFEINTYVTNKHQKGTLIIIIYLMHYQWIPLIFLNSIPLEYSNGEIIGIDNNILLNASFHYLIKIVNFIWIKISLNLVMLFFIQMEYMINYFMIHHLQKH